MRLIVFQLFRFSVCLCLCVCGVVVDVDVCVGGCGCAVRVLFQLDGSSTAPTRTLELPSAPTSLAFSAFNCGALLAGTVAGVLLEYDTQSGRLIRSFRFRPESMSVDVYLLPPVGGRMTRSRVC